MPWSKQDTTHSKINKAHFYKKLNHNNYFKYPYQSLCGHFFLTEITSDLNPKDKCKICDKIHRRINGI